MKDLNDRLMDGTLPADPAAGGTVVANEAPRVLTVRELVYAAHKEATDGKRRMGAVTGHYLIDKVTGGVKPGFVWVFGADTSWGKSSFLVMLADENIKRRKRVLIVSAEDSEKIYGNRLLLRRSKVNANHLREGDLTEDEHKRLANVVKSAEDLPVFLDARGKSVERVAAMTKELIRAHQIDVVAFDYLQAFDNEKPQQDRRNQVSYIARTLTDVAKNCDVAGIIFSQITVQDGKPHPDKHSIRESRDVSNAAEVVMLGFTPGVDIVNQQKGVLAKAGQKCILIDKCKDGPRGGLYPMSWNEHSACFDSVLSPTDERIEANAREYDDLADNYDPDF